MTKKNSITYNNYHTTNYVTPIQNSQSFYPRTYTTSYSNSYHYSSSTIHYYRPSYYGYSYRTYYYYPDYYYSPYYGYGYGYYYNPFGLHYYYPYYHSYSHPYYYNNYNYYYNRPNYSEYYKESNLMASSYYNSYDLEPEYDPTDWMPLYDSFFDTKNYIISLNEEKIKQIKLKLKCSSMFCLLLIENMEDGSKYDKTKTRIYLDVIMRNFAFIDNSTPNEYQSAQNVSSSDTLSLQQKVCLVKNFYESESSQYHAFNTVNLFVSSEKSINPIMKMNKGTKKTLFFSYIPRSNFIFMSL